jgi:hypothetical protein
MCKSALGRSAWTIEDLNVGGELSIKGRRDYLVLNDVELGGWYRIGSRLKKVFY